MYLLDLNIVFLLLVFDIRADCAVFPECRSGLDAGGGFRNGYISHCHFFVEAYQTGIPVHLPVCECCDGVVDLCPAVAVVMMDLDGVDPCRSIFPLSQHTALTTK